MDAPKISVIIPLYNAEKFIRQCLISVLASKFKDYEVIVVDDCSTDNSVSEVKKLLPHFDGRLKLLSTEKNSGGAGVPRNIGIKNAAGKYITFIDNDDIILPTALGNFFQAAETFNADVVHTVKAFIFYYIEGKILNRADLQLQSDSSDDGFTSPKLETKDLRRRMEDYIDGKYFWLPWGKFYRRNFLLENKIDFPQVSFSEDMIFCFKCLCLSENYLRVPFATNIHRIRNDSLSKNFDFQTWQETTLKIIFETKKFMSGLEYFRRESNLYRKVLNFFIEQNISAGKNISQGTTSFEMRKVLMQEVF